MSATCLVPPHSLRQQLKERLGDLTMLPAVAAKAIVLADDPDCQIPQFASVVKRDVRLASEILTVANSPSFGGAGQIGNLEQAVVRLGFRCCKSLIFASCATSLMRRLPLHAEWVREVLWRHSNTTASAASFLNRSLDLGFQGEEFTAGLLHDFGRLLFATCVPEEFEKFDRLAFDEREVEHLDAERKATGINHAEFGAWFSESSGIPRAIVDVIQFHHVCPTTAELDPLVLLVQTADQLANFIQRGDMGSWLGSEPGAPLDALLAVTGKSRLKASLESIESRLIREVQLSIN